MILMQGADPVRVGQALWMVLAMSLAAAATVFAKALTAEMHVVQILWLRLIFGSLLVLPMFWMGSKRWLPSFGILHVIRAVVLIGMTGLWFFALKLGPVSQAAAMSYTYPIFTLVFAALFFGQKIRGLDVGSIGLSFIGVAITFRMGWSGSTLGGQDILQMAVVLCSSLLIAIRMSIERVMTFNADPEDILLGSMIIATILVAPIAWPLWITPTYPQIGLLFAMALTATLSQFFVIKLLRNEAWSVVSIFAFWEVLAAIMLGILIFGESLSAFGRLGALLIVIGGVLQVGRKMD